MARLTRLLGAAYLLALGAGICVASRAPAADTAIRFHTQIRPLLSEKCFHCHGPDEQQREAGLRLDQEVSAKESRDGKAAIVPGDLSRSEMWRRISSSDGDIVMPPPDANRPLSTEQKELLRQWIEQGASWGKHWAFEPLIGPDRTPTNKATAASAESPLDSFVSSELKQRGLDFAPRADARILARRLSLDLIGLPPSPEEADRFAELAARDFTLALDRFVDDLLASPRFGEHWARLWLDLARYADTKGYEKDLGRDMWLYRDWVINALNADMPFDQFTIEQLAGDLLPSATNDQLIATAFHRNTMTNDEGGTDDEEFRVTAVKDRVDTTIQVWMGLTMGCAKCHSHKYDPIAQRDYFSFYAIFNQTADADRGDDSPRLSLPTDEQLKKQTELSEAVKAARERMSAAGKRSTAGNSKAEAGADEGDSAVAEAKKELNAANERLRQHNATIASVPVMRELAAGSLRATKIHNRGNFLDQGEAVEPAVIPGFGNLPEGVPVDRLAAARWLVSDQNPLTARVMANRIWARLFGVGIVETEEDFGAQGTSPSHPQLLDWLALHYRDDCAWSLKKLLKTIVLSRTYQQAYLVDDRRREADPGNVWLSRASRHRLTAEMVRDQALSVAGLLSGKLGGRSVMPPQPAGLWKSTYNAAQWVTATGEDRYRRGLYTYWKRTTPYPSMLTFDAGSREVCQVRRIHTNTPLQALVLLNDPVYLEAAAALAARMIRDATDDSGRAERGLRLALIRTMKSEEVRSVVEAYRDAMSEFRADAKAARALLRQANATVPSGVDEASFAAWTVAASVILNLDEALMRG